MQQVGQTSPQHFLLEGGEAKWRRSSLLNCARMIAGIYILPAQFGAKPFQPLPRQVVPQEFHGICVWQIEFGRPGRAPPAKGSSLAVRTPTATPSRPPPSHPADTLPTARNVPSN